MLLGCHGGARRDDPRRTRRQHGNFHSVAEKASRPEWFLRGPLVRPDERRFTSPAMLVGIRLRPGVAFLLSGIPAHSMVGRRIGLKETAAFQDLVAEDLHPLHSRTVH